MSQPLDFTYITDSQLRASLESDFEELAACMASSSWKSVYVLSGAIIEAAIVDYLQSIGYTKKDPTKLMLGPLIDIAKEEGALTDVTTQLCAGIRDYRNLIHPGRQLRLKEQASEDGAVVAQALVAIIVREIAAKRMATYGTTADQLVAKLESDPTAIAIASHLLTDAIPKELERLLVAVIPDMYAKIEQDISFDGSADPAFLTTLGQLYSIAYSMATPEIRKSVAKAYVRTLKEGHGDRVEILEGNFFRADFLNHLTSLEVKVAVDHLVAGFEPSKRAQADQLPRFVGLSAHVLPSKIRSFTNFFTRAIAYGTPAQAVAAADYLEEEFNAYLPEALEERVREWIVTWTSFLADKGNLEGAQRMSLLTERLILGTDLPTPDEDGPD